MFVSKNTSSLHAATYGRKKKNIWILLTCVSRMFDFIHEIFPILVP